MKKLLYISILLLVSLSLHAQSVLNESQISIRGTAINNIGEIKELWESGTAIYVSYENISSTQFSYMFQVGYIGYKENPNYEFEGDDPSFHIIPLQVGGRYYILTDWIRPFLMAMTGVNIVSSNYALMPDEHDTGHDEYSGTNAKLNFQFGLGLAFKIISNLKLEAIVNYNSHILDAPTHYNVTGLEIGVGLNWGL
jgi:opacity protein-like surface antigen